MTTHLVRMHRVLCAYPEKGYRALLDPDAMVLLAKLIEADAED
jgi:hypothetical protein